MQSFNGLTGPIRTEIKFLAEKLSLAINVSLRFILKENMVRFLLDICRTFYFNRSYEVDIIKLRHQTI